jgi:hypothetical protein
MSDEELYAHPGWDWCTFEGARRQVLLEGLKTSFREKLQWLEDAEALALRFRAASGNGEPAMGSSDG